MLLTKMKYYNHPVLKERKLQFTFKKKKEKRTLHMNKYKKKLYFSSLIFHLIYNVTLNFWNAQFTSQQK